MKICIFILVCVCAFNKWMYAQQVVNEGKVWIVEVTKEGRSIADVDIRNVSYVVTVPEKKLQMNGSLQNIYLENGMLSVIIPFEQISILAPIENSDVLELTVMLDEEQVWTGTKRFCPVNGWGNLESYGSEGLSLSYSPSIAVKNIFFTEAGAKTLTASLSNVPAGFWDKGYRIDWGSSLITTGAVKGSGPYEITGIVEEGFEAPAGEMKVRLMKDTVMVAEAALLPRAVAITVPNKEICSGLKGEKVIANVTAWGPGYFIRWLDNSFHVESRLVPVSDTEAEVQGDFPEGEHTLWAWLFDATGDLIATTLFTLTVQPGPAAPVVAIDTNTSRLDIKIHWQPVSGATGYNVYSRKWDSYCLTSENGGAYAKTAISTTSYPRTVANVATDTLAFFYVTATNGTCESASSDTVGYVRHYIDATNSDITVNYVFPYIFDMSRYLAGNKIQHLLYYFFNGNVIRRGVWNYDGQKFMVQNYMSSLNKWSPPNPADDSELKIGESYLIGAKTGTKVEFVQLGYLKDTRVNFIVRATAGKVSNTPVWLPFAMTDKNTYNTMTEKLWTLTECKLSAIGFWSLEIRNWDMINALPGYPGGPFFDERQIRPGFDSVVFDANEAFVWP